MAQMMILITATTANIFLLLTFEIISEVITIS